jgi:hypothetical protein
MRISIACIAALALTAVVACDDDPQGVDPGQTGSATLRFYNFTIPPDFIALPMLPDTGSAPVAVDVRLDRLFVYETGLGYADRSGTHPQDLLDLPKSSDDDRHLAQIRISEADSAGALAVTGVWLQKDGVYDLFSTGQVGGTGSAVPGVVAVERDPTPVQAGRSRLQLVHAIPDYDSLDVYVGTRRVATLAGFRRTATAVVTPGAAGDDSLTVTLVGQPPAYDDVIDVYHSSSVTLVADSTTTLVLSYRSRKTTPGGDNETVFQYLE